MFVNVLPFGQRNLALDKIIFQVDTRGDEREAPFLRAPRELVDFAAMQKQASVPQRIMVKPAARSIRADVAINQPHLVILDHRVTVLQIDLALSYRFHFRSRQLDATLEGLQ